MGLFDFFKNANNVVFQKTNIFNKAMSGAYVSEEEKATYYKITKRNLEEDVQTKLNSIKKPSTPPVAPSKSNTEKPSLKNTNDTEKKKEIQKFLYILKRINNQNSTSQTKYELDDIRKLKGLLDDNLITYQEYEIKRRQILGL